MGVVLWQLGREKTVADVVNCYGQLRPQLPEWTRSVRRSRSGKRLRQETSLKTSCYAKDGPRFVVGCANTGDVVQLEKSNELSEFSSTYCIKKLATYDTSLLKFKFLAKGLEIIYGFAT